MGKNMFLVVTMGCSLEDVCPAPLLAKKGRKIVGWNLEDSNGKEKSGMG